MTHRNKLGRNTSSANETADSELLSGHTGLHGSLDKTTHQTLRWRPWGQQPPSQCTSSQYERDVSGRLHSHNPLIPTSNATVSTVGATSHHGSVVHLDVVDHQVLHVQSLRLAVRLQVVQEHQEELARRLGPSAQIAGSLHQVALGVTADRSVVSAERNHVLVGDHVVEVLLGLHQGHSLDGSTHLVSVLEVDGQVGTASEAACKGERGWNGRTLSGVHRSRTTQRVNNPLKQTHHTTQNRNNPPLSPSIWKNALTYTSPFVYRNSQLVEQSDGLLRVNGIAPRRKPREWTDSAHLTETESLLIIK